MLKKISARLKWIGSARTPSSAVFHTLISRFGSLAISLGMGVIVARSLMPAGRGEVGAINLWPTVLCNLLTLGVPVALRYEIRRRPDDDGTAMFSAALVLSIILGIIATIIGFVALPFWLGHYSPKVVWFAQLMMLFAPQIMLQLVVQAFLEAKGNFVQANRILYVPQAITLGILLLLAVMKQLTPYTGAVAYSAPPLLVTLSSLYVMRRFIRFRGEYFARWRELLHYGIRAYGLTILQAISSQLDQAIVVGLLSATSFGLYVVALNVSRALQMFSLSLNTVLFPQASALEPEEVVKLVGQSARLVFACTALSALVFATLLPFIIPLAYGREFQDDIYLTRILTVEVVLNSLNATLAQAFMATGRPGIVTILQACGVATAVPLMLILIPRVGLSGAAYAILGSTSIRLTLILLSYPVFLRARMPRLILDRADLRYLFARMRMAR